MPTVPGSSSNGLLRTDRVSSRRHDGRTRDRDEVSELLQAARRLAANGSYLFFKSGKRFCNPLVSAEWQRLSDEPSVHEPEVLAVVERLVERAERLEPGIYSPVPIARSIRSGMDFDAALASFRYEMIVVDDEQEWWWQGKPVAPRLRRFFVEHLGYEPELDLYYFEYRVSDNWFDKCYLIGDMTPMLGTALHADGARLVVTLNNGARDPIDPESLHLDERERLFCRSESYGSVLLSDGTRFNVLRSVSEDLSTVHLFGRDLPLRWGTSVDG